MASPRLLWHQPGRALSPARSKATHLTLRTLRSNRPHGETRGQSLKENGDFQGRCLFRGVIGSVPLWAEGGRASSPASALLFWHSSAVCSFEISDHPNPPAGHCADRARHRGGRRQDDPCDLLVRPARRGRGAAGQSHDPAWAGLQGVARGGRGACHYRSHHGLPTAADQTPARVLAARNRAALDQSPDGGQHSAASVRSSGDRQNPVRRVHANQEPFQIWATNSAGETSAVVRRSGCQVRLVGHPRRGRAVAFRNPAGRDRTAVEDRNLAGPDRTVAEDRSRDGRGQTLADVRAGFRVRGSSDAGLPDLGVAGVGGGRPGRVARPDPFWRRRAEPAPL